jgi:hypothetical protein
LRFRVDRVTGERSDRHQQNRSEGKTAHGWGRGTDEHSEGGEYRSSKQRSTPPTQPPHRQNASKR